MDSKINEQVLNHCSEPSGNGRISPRSSILGSPECMSNSGGDVTECYKSEIEGTDWDNNHAMPSEIMGLVNNNDILKPNSQHEIVNNRREHLNLGAQLMHVNSDDDKRPENEDHFEENEDQFD